MCGYFCIGFIGFMLAGKTLIEFTNPFSPNNFKKRLYNFKIFYEQRLKMCKCNCIKHDFHETPDMYPNMNANISYDQQFRLNKINEIKDYFIAEIRERELTSKNLCKYMSCFEYLDKSLIVLSVATDSISVASFATAFAAPVGIMSASCCLASSITTGFVKKVLKNNKK